MALRPLPLLTLVFLMALLRNSEERKYLKSFAGPFWAHMIKFYDCPPGEVTNPWLNFTFRFLNQPRTHLDMQRLSSHGEVKRDLTDALLTTLEGDLWANNQWKENAIAKMSLPKFACSAYRTYIPDLAHKVFNLEVDSKEPCIIPVGKYAVENVAVNWTIRGFPQFFYGQYRMTAKFYDGKTPVYCYVAEIRISPRPT